MARKLRVGFVGLGRVFDLNVRGYLDHPEAEVAALCDSRPRPARPLARPSTRGALATRDFEEFLRSDLDLIEILTPHPLHEAMTVAALAGGAHVSVQKPMAMTLRRMRPMIAAADASGRRLKVFENFIFYPPLVRARELLREGAIGKPLHFRMKVVMADRAQAWPVPEAASRWRHALAAEGRGGPIVFDHGHHMMAVALWLFGDVRDGFACIERTRDLRRRLRCAGDADLAPCRPAGARNVGRFAGAEDDFAHGLLRRRRAVRNPGRGGHHPGHALLRPDARRAGAHALSRRRGARLPQPRRRLGRAASRARRAISSTCLPGGSRRRR